MRVWIDAQTGKQARLAVAIGRVLQEAGFEVLVTGRDYDFTRGIIEASGLPYRIVGGYGGASLLGKLEADVERMRLLLEIVSEYRPDVLVSYPIPSAVRIAYGLAIPSIVLSDSPHSRHVHLLTLPLARYLIHSSFIPTALFQDYILPHLRVITFRGVDEWEWVEGHRCDRRILDELDLEPNAYIVLRTPEFKASYYSFSNPLRAVAELTVEAVKRGYRVIVFPRYAEDAQLFKRLAEQHKGSVIVWRGAPLETLDLYCYAAGVITGGATMAREAALMCRPAVSLYPVYINIVLEKMGLPIRSMGLDEGSAILDYIESFRGREVDCSVVEVFEKPSMAVLRAIEEIHAGKPS